MITVGDKEVVLSQTIIARDGEEFTIEFPSDDGTPVKLRGVFVLDEQAKTGVHGERREGGLFISFTNWRNKIGTALPEPALFAKTAKGTAYRFFLTHKKLGTNVNQATFQIVKGGTNE